MKQRGINQGSTLHLKATGYFLHIKIIGPNGPVFFMHHVSEALFPFSTSLQTTESFFKFFFPLSSPFISLTDSYCKAVYVFLYDVYLIKVYMYYIATLVLKLK